MTKTYSRSLPAMIVTILALTVTRYIQFAVAVDFETGFFNPASGFIAPLYYIVLGLGFAALLISSSLDRKARQALFYKKPAQLDESACLLFGLLFIVAAVGTILTGSSTGHTGAGREALINLLVKILGVLGFAAAGIVLCRQRRAGTAAGVLMLIPAAYCTLKAMRIFLEYFILLQLSDHLIRMIAYLLMALFFLAAGRILLQTDARRTRQRFLICGGLAGGLIVSEVVSKLVYWFSSSEAMRDYLASGAAYMLPDAEFFAAGILVVAMTWIFAKTPDNADNIDNIAETVSVPVLGEPEQLEKSAHPPQIVTGLTEIIEIPKETDLDTNAGIGFETDIDAALRRLKPGDPNDYNHE